MQSSIGIDNDRGAASSKLLTEAFVPQHILVDSILAYLDLHSLVVFSGCSRICHDVVFKQTPKDRWETIYLCGGKPCSIDDAQLSAFLRNINAVENTKVLSLVGCPSLTGRGIEPLTGSTVLEDIDLRMRGTFPLKGELAKRQGDSSFNKHSSFITRVLRTMLPLTASEDIAPFKLRRVVLPRATKSDGCWNLYYFFKHLKSCKKSFANQLISKHCNKQSTCLDTCGGKEFGTCSKCMEVFCFTCSFDQNYVKCSLCEELQCPSCKEGQNIKCVVCEKSWCNACAMPPKCSMCNVQKCQWCSNVYECGGCGKQSCANHGAECCNGCDTNYCSDCQDDHVEFCIVCNEHYCSDNNCHDRMH